MQFLIFSAVISSPACKYEEWDAQSQTFERKKTENIHHLLHVAYRAHLDIISLSCAIGRIGVIIGALGGGASYDVGVATYKDIERIN